MGFSWQETSHANDTISNKFHSKLCINNNNNNTSINNNNNNNNNNTINNNTISDISYIKDFYVGGSIFITGGTGFIGKALTEKLLRTCCKIRSIYLLVRPKRGQSVQERWEQLLQNPVFNRIRSEQNEGLLSKIICIAGDVTEPELGISEKDREKLLEDVTVVFHSAATVRFNESLPTAVGLNTLGTQRVVLFCRQMKKLKVLIHVSTAYSNADKEEILETVYPLPVLDCLKSEELLSESILSNIGEKLGIKHPNTYTVTKAMAEWMVAENADEIPVGIVRPSIVTAAWREPFPGWVDNVSGITGIMMEIGRGTIRSIICDQRLVVDIVPVDMVVNTLVAAAWHTATYRSNATRVYNCTSGTLNPLRWEELGALTQLHSLTAPSMYIQWYPGFTFRTNKFIHLLYDALFHFLPAFVLDAVFRASGSKPIMLKIYQRFSKAAKTGEFFALHQWNFANEHLRVLHNDMESIHDQEMFNVDISTIDWDIYIKNYILGIRKYILKDCLDTVPQAKVKLHRLFWAHRILQISAVFLIFKMIRM